MITQRRGRSQSLPSYTSLPNTNKFIPADLMTCNNRLLEEGFLPPTIVIPSLPKATMNGMLVRRNSSHLFYNLNIERPVALDGNERVILSDIKEQKCEYKHEHGNESKREKYSFHHEIQESNAKESKQTLSNHPHHRLSKRPREAEEVFHLLSHNSLSNHSCNINSSDNDTDKSVMFSEFYKYEIEKQLPSIIKN